MEEIDRLRLDVLSKTSYLFHKVGRLRNVAQLSGEECKVLLNDSSIERKPLPCVPKPTQRTVFSVAAHPRAVHASCYGMCSKCKVHVTVDLKRNGVPYGLIFDFFDPRWKRKSFALYEHMGCGGMLKLFKDSMPEGYGLYESKGWRTNWLV